MSVSRFLIHRLLQAIPLLFGLVTFVFLLTRVLPGDPTTVFLSPLIPASVADQLREQFGLNRGLFEQYISWLGAVVHGDLGYSFTYHTPVADVLASVVPNTVLLGAAALFLEVVLALFLVSVAVRRPDSAFDRLLSHFTLIVYAIPSFWIGIILLSVFSYGLGMFPSSGIHSAGESGEGNQFDLFAHMVLPALTVAIPGAAGLARYLRTSIGGMLHQEFVIAARSMGLSGQTIFRSYVLPNSLGPMVSLIGIEIGVLLTGVIVTETLFAWPGMGRLTVMAILARDYPLILGATIVAGVAVILGNLLADIVNAVLDPRVRLTA
ncbi:MAG TPA: ABC transporter permease [Bacteroidota bacterium]|nr:ABC transporter permease [Bacteroidota bacterium]